MIDMKIRQYALIFSIVLFLILIIQNKIKGWKKAFLVLFSLAFALSTGFHYVVPLYPPSEPSGDLEVLKDTVYYRYESDIDEMLTHGPEREVPVKVWYPRRAQVNTHPLIIFSPGSFGVAESNETLFLELASRGYVIMSLNHPYHSFFCTMSDGDTIMMDWDFIRGVAMSQGSEDTEGTWALSKEWTGVRIDDINFVLDKVLDSDLDNKYEGYIDKNRIVLSGHSLGGSAALAIGREKSEDIQALVILEAPFFADIIGIDGDKYVFTEEDYPLPVLHIYSDALYSRLDEITTYEMNYRLLKSGNPIYVNKHIEGVGHLGLTDMVLVSPIITNMIDMGLDIRHAPETLPELNGYVLEFLEEFNK